CQHHPAHDWTREDGLNEPGHDFHCFQCSAAQMSDLFDKSDISLPLRLVKTYVARPADDGALPAAATRLLVLEVEDQARVAIGVQGQRRPPARIPEGRRAGRDGRIALGEWAALHGRDGP